MSRSSSQGLFYWVKNYFTFYWHVLSSKVLLLFPWENTGPYYQVRELLSLSQDKVTTAMQCTRLGPHHPAVLSLAQLKFWGQGHLWTQVGSPVKSLLKPQSQNLNGAHFPTATKVKNYASHRSDSMVLVRVVFQPHWFCDSVIWSAAASMESLKKELGLHQEDSDSGPFQLLRLTPPFSHSAENYYCHSKPGSLQQSALPLHRFGSAWLR